MLRIALAAVTTTAALVVTPVFQRHSRAVVLQSKKNDKWKDEQMEEQYAMLARRRNAAKREDYFSRVFEKRQQATKDQYEKWRFQREEGQDPLIAWKKMRNEGKIGDLKTGLGVDGQKKEGGIPLPLPSFGVGGEAGVRAFPLRVQNYLANTGGRPIR